MGFGKNRDGGSSQIREDIHRSAERDDSTIKEQPYRGDDNDEPVIERPLNNPVQHNLLHFVQMGTGFGGTQFLQLELIGPLSHHTLAFLNSGEDRDLVAILVTEHNVAPFEFLS